MLALAFSMLAAAGVQATPGAGPPRATRAARAPTTALFGEVLARHAKRGGVDYAGLAADVAARRKLQEYLDSAAHMARDAPLSDWLNTYNAGVIQRVVDRYPLGSVKDIPGFFDTLTWPVAGKARTLDAIENGVVRPRFRDARVHAALNCGARSCPPLAARPFEEETLDARLDALARRWASDARHVRVERGVLRHSAIFSWYAADFVRDAGSVLAWIQRYTTQDAVRALPADTRLEALPYDWALNDVGSR